MAVAFFLHNNCICPLSADAVVYPASNRDSTIDVYHGVKIPDPYRWLENNESAETRHWITEQNKVTRAYLDKFESRDRFKNRLREILFFDKVQPPSHRGGRYFSTRLSGLQNQTVLYVADDAKGKNQRVLVDPNVIAPDGTVALVAYSVSDDGKTIAYGLNSSGSDWTQWQFIDVESGRTLPDKLDWIKFGSASFTRDGSGVFYGRYPESSNKLKDSNYYQKLYFHKLGTAQKDDQLILENAEEKTWSFYGRVSEDGAYLVIDVRRSTDPENLVYYKDLRDPSSPMVRLIDKWGTKYTFMDNNGSEFFFHTDLNAPRSRVVSIDVSKVVAGKPLEWHEVIPQASDNLRQAFFCQDIIVAHYLKDAHSQLKLYSMKGQLSGEVALPGIGAVAYFSGRRADSEMYYTFSSFTRAQTIFSYDVGTKKSELIFQPVLKFDPDEFETKQVWFTSKDGTRIPMFVTGKKGAGPDNGPHRTYLYGYGGFDAVIFPWFRPDVVAWLEKGGLFAVPNLRGGGEYGEEWHQAGMREKKQNVFDDFISAAKWLIENKYTTSKQLAIHGASNGGLLVGATLTQQPDLIAAAVPEVGVLDMLRYHKFTIGHAWSGEYGTADDPAGFKYLRAYSPLHNIRQRKYPATLVVTGDHDDRVVPAHSFKFAAALQEAQTGSAPVLIRVETQTGHGFGKPTTKQIEEFADKWTFMWENTATQSVP